MKIPLSTRVTAEIPELVKRALDAHAELGHPCGHFVTAVLENNLANAVGYADEENYATLREIVQYVYWELPSLCWGSREKVEAWRRKFAEQSCRAPTEDEESLLEAQSVSDGNSVDWGDR